MVASVAFLVVLDAIIIGATPDITRIAFAAIVTMVVGFTIARIWRGNVAIERAAASKENPASKAKRQALDLAGILSKKSMFGFMLPWEWIRRS
ncbi:MAG: hypothetical protein OK455_08615 [Thaumarchaeota archaeon]|nr:hypothetical protein [Nitrososphaerota archaeon]